MGWIVLGEKEQGRIELVSSSEVEGILPKGSFLTIEENKTKFILRIDNSTQHESYSPQPLVVDMDLTPLEQDRDCKNKVIAYRICTISDRQDGLIDFVRPQSEARRSNQEEIDISMGVLKKGPKVFVATVQYNQNQILSDEKGAFITSHLPEEMFFHQTLVCGRTGSGKTVATKYLAQYFVEEMGGAILAINVKEADFLRMDHASTTENKDVKKEWQMLGKGSKEINNFMVYHPSNTEISRTKDISPRICQKITLDVKTIEPESLIGLLQKISDVGAMNLPDIFRHWQENEKLNGDDKTFKFSRFVNYFQSGVKSKLSFETLNENGDIGFITLHRGTFDNILRNLNAAVLFFDKEDAETLKVEDILEKGKMSVIDVASKNGIHFGSILLRHLLHKIVEAKSEHLYDIPILIIIDEVHMFYDESAALSALGDLDTICRTGRSMEIGVIFSSQNPSDIPRGLSSVINSKIFFKSDLVQARSFGVSMDIEEMESLKKGFALVSIHDLSQLKIVKFPMSFAGVLE